MSHFLSWSQISLHNSKLLKIWRSWRNRNIHASNLLKLNRRRRDVSYERQKTAWTAADASQPCKAAIIGIDFWSPATFQAKFELPSWGGLLRPFFGLLGRRMQGLGQYELWLHYNPEQKLSWVRADTFAQAFGKSSKHFRWNFKAQQYLFYFPNHN